ncbi:MAG TPA: fatty acid cis/trans isomerase [Polyangiaceae bacterium]|nr:fatty acid cis/trans isomerase [Polyangiaceae bacterium]
MQRRVLLSLLVGAVCAAALAGGCRARSGRPPEAPPSSFAQLPPLTPAQARAAWEKAQSVLETRCVVCHGCYDAPCQLKLGSFEGIDRGATPNKVYDGARLVEATPTRLFIDAHSRSEWVGKGFHPVLPEVTKSGVTSDARASVLSRMLALKRAHPLGAGTDVAKDFTLDLDRAQTCADANHFDDYARAHPSWGMPYALPALGDAEDRAVADWIDAGAPHTDPPALPAPLADAVASWEEFLNEPSLEGRLAGRYIYEHLFLASLYFEGVDERTFFRLVRSRTPIGPVDEIATRRPFEDPKSDRVYYRLVVRAERPLAKTQMPYALGPARLALYRKLFLGPDVHVDRLPGYAPAVAANPFRAFEALPVAARYRFMLDEAEFTMMGFIKGPVCRGQVALDVIEDRFWIAFLSPDASWTRDLVGFLAGEKLDLEMPASGGSDALPSLWFGYGAAHDRYVKKKNQYLDAVSRDGGLTLRSIWNGDGHNPNAGLTVFRHFDSATVVQGFVGGPPKTAWIVDYPLLERIHYLLVAGFDVFGNVTHQVTTRLYMDFLRMEGESNFLTFLPPARRKELEDAWYRGVDGKAKERVDAELAGARGAPGIRYASATPEIELFASWKGALGKALATGYDLDHVDDAAVRAALEKLAGVRGTAASFMPETSFLAIEGAGGAESYASVLRESAHTNVAQLFAEKARRVKSEDSLTVVRGFLGAYPNALFAIPQGQLGAFVDAVAAVDGEAAYKALRERFGVLRTSPSFWGFSDRINEAYRRQAPVEGGLFDYNRLDPL